MSEEVKLQIKIVLNNEKNKVLFAEAGSDFTDVLLSFLLLPLGTMVRVLENHYGSEAPVIGSLTTLYNSVKNMDSIHFNGESEKQSILIPTSNYERQLQRMRFDISYPKPNSSVFDKIYNGVLGDRAASFIFSDDLRLMPNLGGSIIKTLSNLGIDVTDMDGVETKNVAFGLNEIMALLKGSLVSQTPLSDLLCHRSQMSLATLKYEHGSTLLAQINDNDISSNSKKMILTVMIKKSNKTLLFAQADEEFINFLFGILTLPLGKAEWYFNSNIGLNSIDNLHHSISADTFDEKLLLLGIYEDMIVKPTWSFSGFDYNFAPLNFNPRIRRKHVKASRMYMVTDNLTVAPSSMTSSLALLKGMKISLSDVEELELQVGLKEGLSILKAALTSTTALTDGLITPMLMKQQN